MTSDTLSNRSSLLSAKVAIPRHVVYRSFPNETVVLNLQTGKYHGLNATAGSMLLELEKAASVGAAAQSLASAFGASPDLVEHDICALCRDLMDRGLIEIDGGNDDGTA